MATLVLTVVGGAIGGPFGASLGAALGQAVDQRLFGPKGRSGPRLGELAVQSSTYGGALPRVYGRARLSGQVIWATDLTETREKVKTGKGQPKQTIYSYSANFAVALSSRRIASVGRIWADGKLLRGAAGDFKTPTEFRLYTGSDDQAPDPLILSAEGAGNAPAYRGLAYAVFENFQLGDYGNRIPSLSFEVVADDGDVSVAEVLNDVLPSGFAANCPVPLGGMAVTGSDVRGLIESFAPAITLRAVDDGAVVTLTDQIAVGAPLALSDLGSAAGDAPAAGGDRAYQRARSGAALPSRLDLGYYDSLRDYQSGLQRARRGASGSREEAVDLAASLSPEQARSLAERALQERWRSRDRVTVTLPWHALPIAPGQRVTLPGLTGDWTVRTSTLEGMVIEMLVERMAVPPPARAADPGRAAVQADTLHGPTTLHLLDLPWLGSGTASEPQLLVAANGVEVGWRRAALSLSRDMGLSWEDAGLTAAPALIGATTGALGTGPTDLIDQVNQVIVTMLRPDLALTSASMAALLAGQNLAVIGEELVQFAQADLIAPGRYRLSDLLRGRRGTEWAMASHTPGERFILIEPESLVAIPVAADSGQLSIMAIAQGDDVPVVSSVSSPLAAVLPPAPVHLQADFQTGGDTLLRWTRRSRSGWGWPDLVDAPLAEESEAYRIILTPSAGIARLLSTASPTLTYSAADRTADVTAGATSITVAVQQSGTFGLSRPTIITLPLT